VSPVKPKKRRSTVPPVGPTGPPTGMPPTGLGTPARSAGGVSSTDMSGWPDWLGPAVPRHDSLSGKQVISTVPSVPPSGWQENPDGHESQGAPQKRWPETSWKQGLPPHCESSLQ